MSESKENVSHKSEEALRREIEGFYLPKQLVDAILELGEIPRGSVEAPVGVGFLDIADYSFISKFLSPTENQVVLNGLYTAFNWVLRRHGGYLNKIEGDSLMFQFGGLTDPRCRGVDQKAALRTIARELLYSCVEMQRVCSLFNNANDRFFDDTADAHTRGAVAGAFEIIRTLRTSADLGSSANAFFQIRIRIGANLGVVTMGNLGPDGAKHWDITGMPVIVARRMEASAPVGGLRITKELYDVLAEAGIVGEYLERFRRESGAMFGVFKDIREDELFKKSTVVLRDKRGASFETYSVQVSPGLPEGLAEQTRHLLDQGEPGANRVIEFLQYYRGNRFVVGAIERVLARKGVRLRKADILKVVDAEAFKQILAKNGNHRGRAVAEVARTFSLYELFERLGLLQDKVKEFVSFQTPPSPHTDYRRRMAQELDNVVTNYRLVERSVRMNAYFHNYVFPVVYRSIRTSMIEYQSQADSAEAVDAEALPPDPAKGEAKGGAKGGAKGVK
jgi:adenylate cyclase